jgi:hypothetical protein
VLQLYAWQWRLHDVIMHCRLLLLLQVVLTSAKETTSRVEGKAVALVRGIIPMIGLHVDDNSRYSMPLPSAPCTACSSFHAV